MAMAKFNTTLEYANNTLEFWNVDEVGEPVDFHADTKFYIERIDNPSISVMFATSIDANKATVTVSLAPTTIATTTMVDGTVTVYTTGYDNLYRSTDTNGDYDHPVYHHRYSLKWVGVNTGQVYLYGNLNLVEIA